MRLDRGSGGGVMVIGGGPAGLMAAEQAVSQGCRVTVYDRMPSVGRKFLLAGRGGLNLTHAEPMDAFVARFSDAADHVAPWLAALDNNGLRHWASKLGIDTFVGSSGRVFPEGLKAAPLLRAWLTRLRAQGVSFRMRHEWQGWTDDGHWLFATPDGPVEVPSDTTVLALGGASWKRLGSDGAWAARMTGRGVEVTPFEPANCGFEMTWSAHFRERFAGQPLKNVAAWCAAATVEASGAGPVDAVRGEMLIADSGIEGGLVYTHSRRLREAIADSGTALLYVDLLPDMDAARIAAEVIRPRGARSWSSHLQSRLKLTGAKAGLLRECAPPEVWTDAQLLAQYIKALPLRVQQTRPIDEAISTAGGIAFSGLDAALECRALPGVFCAGEMVDWEAPTGGYLLTATLASGGMAGRAAAAHASGLSTD